MSIGRYIVIDLEKLALLETNVPEEIKECSTEYDNLQELIEDAKSYLDMYGKDAWNAYIQYLKEWALSHEDHKHVGSSPDDFDYFVGAGLFKNEEEKGEKGEKDEQD